MTVEQRLRETLEARASSVKVGDGWSKIAAGVENKRRGRSWFVPASGAVALAAIIAIVAVALAGRGGHQVVVVGPTGPRSAHAQLVFFHISEHPTAEIIDSDTGGRRSVPLPDLLAGSGGNHAALLVGDQIVVQQFNSVYAVPAKLDGPARMLGLANHVYPSATPGKVWLVATSSLGNTGVATSVVREVDTTGQDTSPSHHLPDGFTPEASVDGGLLGVEQPHPPPAVPWFAVWNPATGATSRIEDGNAFVAAAHSTLVTPGDHPSPHRGLPLRFVDLATQAVRTVTPPPGTFFDGPAVLSPDAGALLTIISTGGANKWAVVDVGTGRVTPLVDVPHGNVLAAPGWSPDSQWLFLTAPGPHGRQRIVAYQRGGRAAAEVKATVGQFDAAVVVPTG